jgi:hypothetical protein
MNMQHVFCAALASLCLTGCKSSQPAQLAQPTTVQVQGPYTHSASGMAFPPSVGDFQRVNVMRYDAGGLDVSAGYNLGTPTGEVAATVYVYPAPSLISVGSPPEVIASARATLCNSEFERRKKEVSASHAGARSIQEEDVPPPQAIPPIPGKKTSFEYDDFFGGQRQPLRSELYVFCYVGGRWAFEYRFTSPKNSDAADAISAFMAALRWTVPRGS